MNLRNLIDRTGSENFHDQLDLRSLVQSLLIVYSTTVLMIAVVYLVVSSVVINPHSTAFSDISNKILTVADWKTNHAGE